MIECHWSEFSEGENYSVLILRSSKFGIAGPIQAVLILVYPVTFSQMKRLVFIFRETS